MAYTDRFYDPFTRRPQKRDDRKDLLNEVEDTFYGGGQARPTPTPTPTPHATQLAMLGQPTGVLDFRNPLNNAASRVSGAVNDLDVSSVFPSNRFPNSGASPAYKTAQYALKYGQLDPRGVTQVKLPSGGSAGIRTAAKPFADPQTLPSNPSAPVPNSYYVGPSGTNLGPQYGKTGSVNPLPKGAVGVKGSQNAAAFNRSLNGSQPTPGATPTPQMTHTQMAEDIAKRNLTSAGSLLGTPDPQQQQIPSGWQGYVSPEDAASKGLQWTGGNTGWQPYVSPEEATKRNLQYTGGPSAGSMNAPSQQTVHFLPPGFTTAVGSTGARNSTPNDIHFLPPGFTSVQGTVGENKQLQFQPPKKEDEGYGSAYGY